MAELCDLDVPDEALTAIAVQTPLPDHAKTSVWRPLSNLGRSIFSGLGWLFGSISLLVGLSILAAVPVIQFLSLGYLLEASARVAKSGRLRDGFIGVRRAARLGTLALGSLLVLTPVWLARSLAQSAELIEPGGSIAKAWHFGFATLGFLAAAHLGLAWLRGGRMWHFCWPIGNVLWLRRRLIEGTLYPETRDALWDFIIALRLPRLFKLGIVCFAGTLIWIAIPASLLASSRRIPVLGLLGALLLGLIVPSLPFLQINYAVQGRFRVLFSPRSVRDRFRRAPWAFAFSLFVLLVASVPLYLLKIEMIPREASWLPGLLFVAFLAPARLLTGWAYARSGRRENARHWLFRSMGRLAILPAAILYVLVVFLAQYTSWGGYWSLYDQHAFLLPVPFLSM